MTYAHSWRNVVPTAALAAKARKLVSMSSVRICGPEGVGKPVLEEGRIELNGSRRRKADFGAFSLSGEEHGSVQTGSGASWHIVGATGAEWGVRSYDEVVTAILIAAVVDGNGVVMSDGNFTNWRYGLKLYEKTFGALSREQYEHLRDCLYYYDEVSFQAA